MKDQVSLSIVLPTYNEKENLKVLIPLLEQLIRKEKYDVEILVVDDESPDGTADLAEELNKKYKNIKVIRKNKKEGIGAALVVGYNCAKKNIILSMDTDLSFDYKDIKRFVGEIKKGSDLVLGSRHNNSKHYNVDYKATYIKKLISVFGNKLVKYASGIDIKDFSANFRAIKKDVWLKLQTKEKTNSFLVETIFAAKSKGYKISEIPVIFNERRFGKSKINFFVEAPKAFFKLIKLKAVYG